MLNPDFHHFAQVNFTDRQRPMSKGVCALLALGIDEHEYGALIQVSQKLQARSHTPWVESNKTVVGFVAPENNVAFGVEVQCAAYPSSMSAAQLAYTQYLSYGYREDPKLVFMYGSEPDPDFHLYAQSFNTRATAIFYPQNINEPQVVYAREVDRNPFIANATEPNAPHFPKHRKNTQKAKDERGLLALTNAPLDLIHENLDRALKLRKPSSTWSGGQLDYEKFLEASAAAIKAAGNSYSPYSNFPVGAAIVNKLGEIFTGTNVEHRSINLGLCAERAAVSNMILRGGLVEDSWHDSILGVVVYIPQQFIATCCCGCRQVLRDFTVEAPVVSICESDQYALFTSLAEGKDPHGNKRNGKIFENIGEGSSNQVLRGTMIPYSFGADQLRS